MEQGVDRADEGAKGRAPSRMSEVSGTILPPARYGAGWGTEMKLLTEYLEHALAFERMAAQENNPEIRAQFEKQAVAYRKLVVERAAKYGLPAPSPPPPRSSQVSLNQPKLGRQTPTEDRQPNDGPE
jgi:hypothetical protein